MLLVQHPAAPASLVASDRPNNESEREMLKAFRRKSLGGRKSRSQIAHTDNKRNADVDAALLRQLPDPTNLLEIEPARLLDQKRNTAANQPLSQSRHLGMTAEYQGKVEILFEKIFVGFVKFTIQLIRETCSGMLCGI